MSIKCADVSDVVQRGYEYECLLVTNSGLLRRVGVRGGRQLIFGQLFPKCPSKQKKTPKGKKSTSPATP